MNLPPFRVTDAAIDEIDRAGGAIRLDPALHMPYANFARPHKLLANPYPRTPAMAAGISDHVWTCEEIAALLN